jgi:5-hydroxyisourate hydrolase
MDEHSLTRRRMIRGGIMGGAGIMGGTILAAPFAMAQSSPTQPGALSTAPTSQSGLSPRLTMHAIDTFHGTPGAGMKCDSPCSMATGIA